MVVAIYGAEQIAGKGVTEARINNVNMSDHAGLYCERFLWPL